MQCPPCSLPPPQRAALSAYPAPNVFKSVFVVQSPWSIDPNPLVLLPGSLLRATTRLTAGSDLPAVSTVPAGTPTPASVTLNQEVVETSTPLVVPAGSVIAAGSIYEPDSPDYFLSNITSTIPVTLEPGTYSELTIYGPTTLTGALSLPEDLPLSSAVQLPANTVEAVELVLPDGSVIAPGTPINQPLPAGTTANGGPYVLPEGTVTSGPLRVSATLNGTPAVIDPLVVPPGSVFGTGFTYGGSEDTTVIVPGPYSVPASITIGAPYTLEQGTTFPAGIILPFPTVTTTSVVVTAPVILNADVEITVPTVIAARSSIASYSVIAAGTALPYNNLRPIQLYPDCAITAGEPTIPAGCSTLEANACCEDSQFFNLANTDGINPLSDPSTVSASAILANGPPVTAGLSATDAYTIANAAGAPQNTLVQGATDPYLAYLSANNRFTAIPKGCPLIKRSEAYQHAALLR